MRNTYKKIVSPLYVINIVIQSLVDLVVPIGVCFLIAWLLATYASLGGWIYAVLIPLGAITGFFSMISFILRASAALEAIEKQSEKNADTSRTKEEK